MRPTSGDRGPGPTTGAPWPRLVASRRAQRSVGILALVFLYLATYGWLLVLSSLSLDNPRVTALRIGTGVATAVALLGLFPAVARVRRRRAVRASELARIVAGYAPHRRSWPRRFAGVCLTVVGSAAVAAGGSLGNVVATSMRESYLSVLARVGMAAGGVVVVVVVAVAGGRLLTYSRPRSAPDALRALVADDRAPVLYLRSFADDRASSVVDARWSWNRGATSGDTREVLLSRQLRLVGPVIAVSPPDERLPVLGAARFFVPPDEWQAAVARLMSLSRLVVIRLGESAGLWWEFSHAMRHLQPNRVLLLAPAGAGPADLESALDDLSTAPSNFRAVAARSRNPWVAATVVFDELRRPLVVPVGPFDGEPKPPPPSVGLARALDTSFSRIGIAVKRPTRAGRVVRDLLRLPAALVVWFAAIFLLMSVWLVLHGPAL